MSDLLTNLAARVFGAAPLIQPRPVAIFEPTPGPRPAPWADAAWQPDPAAPVAELDRAAPAEIPAAAPLAPPFPRPRTRAMGDAPQRGAANGDLPGAERSTLNRIQERGEAPQPGAARGDFHRAEPPPRETAGEAGSASMAAARPAPATATWAGAAGRALAPAERAAAPMEQAIAPEGAAAAAAGPGWRRKRLERPPEPSPMAMRQESGLDQIRHERAYRPAPLAPRPAGSGAERSLDDGGHGPHQIVGEPPLSRTWERGAGGEGRQARPNTVTTAEERNRASDGEREQRAPMVTADLRGEGEGLTPPAPATSLAAGVAPGRAVRVEVRPAPAVERRSAPRQVAEAPPAAPPTIQVTIGRIEVRAAPAPPAAGPAPAARPALSLDDYLRQRNQGGS